MTSNSKLHAGPVPDDYGRLWPKNDSSYSYVRQAAVKSSTGGIVPGVVIVRGGPTDSSRRTSLKLTRDEALELAALLTVAATTTSSD